MTPEEKARQLVENMYYYNVSFQMSKECALIAVDELIEVTAAKYWYDVKHEIELL